jgi:hypothetical protein
MRDQQRKWFGQRAGQVLIGVDRQETVDLKRGRDVDIDYSSMGMR